MSHLKTPALRPLALVLLALALLGGIVFARPAPAAPATPGEVAAATAAGAQAGVGRVAVVDIERLFSEAALTQSIREEINAAQASMRQKLQEIQARGQQMTEELKQLAPSSQRYRSLRQEIAMLDAQFQAMQQLNNNEIAQLVQLGNLRFFKAVREATAVVAQQKQIALVLRKSPTLPDNVDFGNQNAVRDLEQKLAQQNTLYADPGTDITADVLARMNEQFRAGGGAPATQPAGGGAGAGGSGNGGQPRGN